MDGNDLEALRRAGFTVFTDLRWPYDCCSANCCQRHRRRLAWFESELDFYVSLVKSKLDPTSLTRLELERVMRNRDGVERKSAP